jgi:hypothetical protein
VQPALSVNARAVLACALVLDALALGHSILTQALASINEFVDFFSYFTVQSNLLAMTVLATALSRETFPRHWQFFRGGVTCYAVVTAITYELFLTSTPFQVLGNLPNLIMHVITPSVLVWFWISYPPDIRLPRRASVVWPVYPVLYVVYTLVRGGVVGWYPYDFLDPTADGGYGRVLGSVLLLLLLCVGIGSGLIAASRRRQRV